SRLLRRGTPTSPANIPRDMSPGESSPPYDPSQPPTASTSMPNATKISLDIVSPFASRRHMTSYCLTVYPDFVRNQESKQHSCLVEGCIPKVDGARGQQIHRTAVAV